MAAVQVQLETITIGNIWSYYPFCQTLLRDGIVQAYNYLKTIFLQWFRYYKITYAFFYCFSASITNVHSKRTPENDSQTSNAEVNTSTDADTENTGTAELNLTDNEQTMPNNIDNSSQASPIPKRRKTSKLQQTLDKREGERLKLLETLVNNSTTNNQPQVKPQSAIKKFFESMAEVVETFPPREQANIRMKVCQLVSDTEIKLTSAMTPMPDDSWNSDYFNL